MKKKLLKFINTKGGKRTLIGTSLFLIFGIACFVIGYGLVDGWEQVIAWFGSQWAIMVYIALGFWVLLCLFLWRIASNFTNNGD